jgi:hypothetical protein
MGATAGADRPTFHRGNFRRGVIAMTRQNPNQRIFHKQSEWQRQNGGRIPARNLTTMEQHRRQVVFNGNDADEWKDACASIDELHPPAPPKRPSPGWPKLHHDALHGFAGDVVSTIEPHTESDPVAILIQFLTCAGSIVGRSYYYQVESSKHHANLFTALVGDSSKSRKGTALGRVMDVAGFADDAWFHDRIKGGLSSGEGFAYEIRDPVQKFNASTQDYEIVDPGVTDKRLLVVETEFASALGVMERAGNILSPMVRKAWDGDKLQTMTKHSPIKATNPHVSIIGHITVDELKARLTCTEAANGFANRFLFSLVKRSKLLPFGGKLDKSETDKLGKRFADIIDKALKAGSLRVTMTDEAADAWQTAYEALSVPKAGLLGAVTARAEAQVIRLAMVYAILDGKVHIGDAHLKAAIALWKYCDASASRIFGGVIGDRLADTILAALNQAGSGGLTRTEVHGVLGRNQSAERIDVALTMLEEAHVARKQIRGSRVIWVAYEDTKNEFYE